MEKSDKVVCIEDFENAEDGHGNKSKNICPTMPKVGEIYTVIDTVTTCECGCRITGYKLKDMGFYWDVKNFRAVDNQYGAEVCERIERELETVKAPMIALFAMRLTIHEDSIEHLKKYSNGMD